METLPTHLSDSWTQAVYCTCTLKLASFFVRWWQNIVTWQHIPDHMTWHPSPYLTYHQSWPSCRHKVFLWQGWDLRGVHREETLAAPESHVERIQRTAVHSDQPGSNSDKTQYTMNHRLWVLQNFQKLIISINSKYIMVHLLRKFLIINILWTKLMWIMVAEMHNYVRTLKCLGATQPVLPLQTSSNRAPYASAMAPPIPRGLSLLICFL